MNNLYRHLLILIAMIQLSGCSTNLDNSDENSSAKIIENSTFDSSDVSLGERHSEQDLERARRNYELLIPYIKISADSMSYILAISEEEATKIGVDIDYYNLTCESLNATNAALKEAFDDGIEVDMIDFSRSTDSQTK